MTLDLRDIQPITDGPKLPTEIIKDKSGKQHKIWSVVLQTNEANNFIRQNTQTFPATCPPTVAPSEALDAKMEQTDVPQYSILFADLTQANRFVKLLNNVIPTLNPPVLIPPPK